MSDIYSPHTDQSAPLLKRVLGPFDLTIFLVAALVNLNSAPVVSSIGPGALLLWAIGFLFFFIPQSIAVLELSARYPNEGGIYNWSKKAFGNYHGFVSGWCYWTNNIFYVPTLLFYIIGFAAFIGGDRTAGFSQNPWIMATAALGLLWLITLINIFGLDVGKWIQNIGVFGTLFTTVLILGIGLLAIRHQGMANRVSSATLFAPLTDVRALVLLSVVCLNYVGVELGPVLGDEIKKPRRTIPRAVIIAGSVTVLLYLLVTFALQVTIPAAEIGVIDGILQGVKRTAAQLGILWIVPPIALLMSLNAAGNTSVWLAGSARIPFVIGLDRYLPAALGKIHRRFFTPYVSLVVQSAASSLFIIISALGSSVTEMYLILLQTTTILQLIPYLYMFAALYKIRFQPQFQGDGRGFFRRNWICAGGAVVGFMVTLGGTIFAFLPSMRVDNLWIFESKLLLGVLGFLLPATFLFRWSHRRIITLHLTPQAIPVTPE